MNNKTLSAAALSFRIWFSTSVLLGIILLFIIGPFAILVSIAAFFMSFPIFIALLFIIPRIEKSNCSSKAKMLRLIFACFLCTLPYGGIGFLLFDTLIVTDDFFLNSIIRYATGSGILFLCSFLSVLVFYKQLCTFFFVPETSNYLSFQTIHNMENLEQPNLQTQENKHANKVLTKAIITGILILVMLIPAYFVSNLVSERESRQNNVITDVTGKWAGPQTLTGPYLYIPYNTTEKDVKGNSITLIKTIILLPEQLNVSGKMIPEIRPRSIYKVLLYKSDITANGSFVIKIPKDINPEALHLNEAKICLGINDFKGIEEKIIMNFNGAEYELSPGLPTNAIDSTGLSSDIALSLNDLNQTHSFKFNIKLKGSKQLHFVPLSGNSKFSLQSTWKNPSFDGNKIPDSRDVSDSGFIASWSFNKANLPFGIALKDVKFNKDDFSFGVTMVQPADQYTKTDRCIKYALLFIGLTFALFFIVELMQKKPLHPVQYVMVGIALIVFFTLLLSVSEFILFDYAYLLAAFATVTLITFYAKGHFKTWRTASAFAAVLSALYGFIFILVRLEDTALLIGSIGLFIVLALIMYASRKINWYGISSN